MPGKTLGAAALALVVMAQPIAAQSALPTITVTPFTFGRLSEEARAAGEQAADDLAERLVASGRFRVLARDWMPLPGEGRSGQFPIATLRSAAAKAGVRYIVFGSMRTSIIRTVSSPSRGYLPMQKGQLLSHIIQSQMRTARPAVKEITRYDVDIELMDGASGEVVRTMRGRGQGGMTPAMDDVANALARLSPALMRAER